MALSACVVVIIVWLSVSVHGLAHIYSGIRMSIDILNILLCIYCAMHACTVCAVRYSMCTFMCMCSEV